MLELLVFPPKLFDLSTWGKPGAGSRASYMEGEREREVVTETMSLVLAAGSAKSGCFNS